MIEPKSIREATSLTEYYQLRGEVKPSIATRGELYERLGLGAALFYIASAEQNSKLLDALIR